MAITANSGPEILFGITVSASGATNSYNEQRGPSLLDLGDALLDPRAQFGYGYTPGNAVTSPTFGFWGFQAIVDYIPSAVSSNNIALAQTPVAGTALTLTAGTGITAVTSITVPETGKLSSGTLFSIDTPCAGSTAAGVSFGQAGTIQIWNPASLGARGITINLTSNLDGGTWSIAGRDSYGFKMTETLTAGSTQLVSKKAYKYISAIQPSTTVTSTGVTVGVADVYGFPFLVQHPAYVTMWVGGSSNATLVSVSTGAHVYGSSLATATSTNGDVRGTYASSIASNGTTTRITMIVSPTIGPGAASPSSVAGLNNITATSFYTLFGATQFSSV